jgi:GNAT superfamily N-acetyltransferase
MYEATEAVVRSARPEDAGRLVELLDHGSLVPGKEDLGDLTPYLAALLEITDSAGDLLVAEVDGKVVGVCQLIVFRHFQSKGGLCAELESMHVHPDWRGEGIGRQLLKAAVDRARQLGCYRLQLTSNNERPDAHRFYESMGFHASHRGFKLLLD